MSCQNPINGIPKQCNEGVGGIKKLYVIAVNDFEAVTVEYSGSTITGFTGTEALSAYTYNVFKNTANATEAGARVAQGGGTLYTQTITMTSSKFTAAKRTEFKLVSLNDTMVVTLDANDIYRVYGLTKGCTATISTATGTAGADANGFTCVFTAEEPDMAPEITIGALTAILVS